MAFKQFIEYFNQRNKLSLRNVRTGQEIWHVFISRFALLLSGLALLAAVFVAVLMLVAYTSILDLIPGYPGGKSREALIESLLKIDSLDNEVHRWELYQQNLSLILDGQLPALAGDTARREGVRGSVQERILLDSILRGQMKSGTYALVNPASAHTRGQKGFALLPPVKGLITRSFAPDKKVFGIEIAPAPGQVVLAVLDGTIIQNTWTPDQGSQLTLQHAGNIVSVYRDVNNVIKQVGDRVKAGEPIAVTGAVTDTKIPYLTFELWYNGSPVDPENYIAF